MRRRQVHAAELERLPPWSRRVVAALLEGADPHAAAERLRVDVQYVYSARNFAARELGDTSALMAALPRFRRGPRGGRPVRQRAPAIDPHHVRLVTTPGPDGHVHVASFDAWGQGSTDLVAGHLHTVFHLELAATLGHSHELTETRA